MKNYNPKKLFLMVSLCVGFSSCSTDDTPIVMSDAMSDQTTQLIVDWNDLWLDIDRYAFGMRPTASARALAYIHLAAYETSVFNMSEYTSNTNILTGLSIDDNERAEEIDIRIALNSCYSRVMSHFMYNISSTSGISIEGFKEQKETELFEGISNQMFQDSRDWGTYIADQIIAYSLTDIEAEQQITAPQPFSYEPPVGDGFWTYSADEERALFPYWGSVRTFVISPEETSTNPPPIQYSESTDSSYYNEMYEVYELCNTAKAEDNDDMWIAEFWSDDVEGLMISPPGRQFSIAGQLVQQFDLDHSLTLALFLRLGFSLNDAAVSSWADKYEYMVMRPNVYIHEFIDAEFQTNLYPFIYWPNPSFPSYPSGHSTFASAASGIFIGEFGDNIDFTDRTHEGRTEFRGMPRQFSSFSEMAEESAFSRIGLGVHMRMDCTEGYRLGHEVSDAVNALNLYSN